MHFVALKDGLNPLLVAGWAYVMCRLVFVRSLFKKQINEHPSDLASVD